MVLGKRKRGGRSTTAQGRRKRQRTMRRRTGFNKVTVHHYKRMYDGGTIVGNALYNPYVNGFNYKFSNLPNYTEFTALYDQFRINYVVTKWYLKIDPSAQTAATASFPRMYYCVDADDDAPPTNINELRNHGRTRMVIMNPNRPVTIKFRPSVLIQAYEGATTTAYIPKWKQFVDCADFATPHYGLKVAIDDLTNTNYQVTVETILYFTMRDVR